MPLPSLHCRGTSPPAFAVTPRVPGLGSEYLVVGLGHGMVAMYSLATGALARAVQLPGVPPGEGRVGAGWDGVGCIAGGCCGVWGNRVCRGREGEGDRVPVYGAGRCAGGFWSRELQWGAWEGKGKGKGYKVRVGRAGGPSSGVAGGM